MSASQVLNAPTYYTTLALNDALPDPDFCNQCKPWKISLKLASKNFHTTRGCQKKLFYPKHIWSAMHQISKTPDLFFPKW